MKKLLLIMVLLTSFNLVNAQKVGNFQLKGIDNINYSFDELKGEKLTAIDFWASWCKPCHKAIPVLNDIYKSYQQYGFEIIGINCDGPRSISKVAPLSKSLQISYPVLLDINSEVMSNLNLMAFPTLILVNNEGKIVWIHEGFVTGDSQIIIDEIEKQLGLE